MIDNHCHLAKELSDEEIQKIHQLYLDNGIERINLMSSNHLDHEWVLNTYLKMKDIIRPCFGVHPWYSHLFMIEKKNKKEHYNYVFNKEVDDQFLQVLPNPIEFKEFFHENFNKFKEYDPMIGEIGLDKIFRIPSNGYYNGRKENKTNYKTIMKHQLDIFLYQLNFALKHDLSLSIHNVKAMSHMVEPLKQESNSIIMLHSYTGSIESLQLLKSIKQRLTISISELNKERIHELQSYKLITESDISIDETLDQINLIREINSII